MKVFPLRLLGLLISLSLAATAVGQPQTRPASRDAGAAQSVRMKVLFSGTESGSITWEKQSDGAFTSATDLAIAQMKITEKLTGRFDGEQLAEYHLEAQHPGQPLIVVDYADGKGQLSRGEQSEERDIGQTGPLLFANMQPQLISATLAAVVWEKKEPQKLEPYMLDAGRKIEMTITPQKERPTDAGIARVFKVELGGLEIEYATAEDGTVVGMDVPVQRLRFIAEGWDSLYVDPLAAYPELSQPEHEVVTEKGVPMQTRDGVRLVADVFRPEAPGKYPVILSRTPYGRATAGVDGPFYAKRGYVFVAQDVRGMGESEGEWDPFVHERQDGYDAVDWVSKAEWSDGNVGMIGASYGGLVQWAAAAEKHPALKCLIPQVSPPDAMRNIPYDHGIFYLFGNLWWSRIVRDREADLAGMMSAIPNPEKLATLPLSKVDDEIFGENLPFFDRWLEREGLEAWEGFDWLADLEQVNIPALHISGWWDGDGIGTKLIWQTLRAGGAKDQWLIYGPWTHAFNTTRKLGDVDYGPDAIIELDSLYVRWFDTWLKGKQVNLEAVPRVRVFVTGANRWIELADWPEADDQERSLFLFADAPANGKTSAGELRDAPADAQEPSRYLFNPANANVPEEMVSMDPEKATTVVEFSKEGNDDDMLLFRTAPLEQALAIGGPIRLTLHFETTARDTDFYASLVDVDPKGVMRQIGMSGKIRAAFLNGMDKPQPVTPGQPYVANIDLWDTAHEFAPGHRMGLMITSNRFPAMARNLGTGEPIKDATRMVVQVNTIHHDAKRPSAVSFRVLWEGEQP
jgi:hypothetical protein